MKCFGLWFLLAMGVFPTALCAEELLKTQSSWDGGKIAYPSGEPEITSVKLKLEVGQTPPFHCHPVPTLGYVLKGTVEVETKDGMKKTFTEGDSVVEVMRTIHRGTAIGGPVEIIVFYAGSTSLPNTVRLTDETVNQHCTP